MAVTDSSQIEVKPLQIWRAATDDKVIRRVRILAKDPRPNKSNYWIYEELGGGVFRTEIGRLGVFPEFNLKYVCELESE